MAQATHPRADYYPNTPAEARRVGWPRVPEHCSGDPSLPWVAHDVRAGTFTYVAEPAA